MSNKLSLTMLAVALCAATLPGCGSGSEEKTAESKSLWYQPETEPSSEVAAEKSQNDVAEMPTQLLESVSPPEVVKPLKTVEKTEERPEPKKTSGVKYGIGASLDGFRPFPADDAWNQEISKAEVDENSDRILAYIGLDGHLHPDFGSGTWNGCPIGIPYIVVPGDQPRVTVEYTAYGDESDPGPFPIPFETPVEGAPGTDGDRHAIIIDRDNFVLYELYRAFPKKEGAKWEADSGAIFNLKTNTKRPQGWTSADAAGLPIFPGLVRYDEVAKQKKISHALRFTLAKTRRAYVAPASHWASSDNNPLLPPLGMRVRLKAEVDISDYPAEAQVILQALKQYGMILADNGSDWFISGCPDERWDNDILRALRKIKVHQLEILKMEKIVTPYSP